MKPGWEMKPLGEVCHVIAGQSPKSAFYNKRAEGLPFYQGKKQFTKRFLGKPEQWTSKITKEAQAGDILLSVRAPVGPVNETTERICIGRGLAAIRPKNSLYKDYLWYSLLALQFKISGKEGAVFPSISRSDVEAIKILIPPLKEQKRIAVMLGKAFIGLENAYANIQTNLEGTRELFQSILHESLSDEKKHRWEIKPLGEIATLLDGDWIETKDQSPGGIRLIQTGNIGEGMFKNKENKSRYIDNKTFMRLKCTEIFPGDCLVSRLPDPVGRAAILPDVNQRTITAVDCSILRPKPNILHPKFFVYYTQSCNYLRDVDLWCTGTTRKRISRKNLGRISVPLPPLKEQQRIINRLDNFHLDIDKLEQEYKGQLTDINDLRQSMLQKAFAGELS